MEHRNRYKLKPSDYEIQRHIDKLDDVARKYEAVWGFDLPGLVSTGLAEKWRKHCRKLNTAITEGNLDDVVELVDGSVRAYGVMDAEARELNAGAYKAAEWVAKHPGSGRQYKICKCLSDARNAVEEGVVVYTLEEVVNILEANQLVNVIKERLGGEVTKVVQKEPFDFNSGKVDLPPEF